MRDNLHSDTPGIVDDTADGDLGANAGEPQYGSLAESQERDLADADVNSTQADGSTAEGADRAPGTPPDQAGATDADSGHVL